MKKLAIPMAWILATGCGAPPKSNIPSLNPEEATELLRYDSKASNWLTYVRKQNPGCSYHIDLPDQSAHQTEIDLDQIVWCGASPGPREYSASAVFVYDKAEGKWKLERFSS